MSLNNEYYTARIEDLKYISLVEGVSIVATVENCTIEFESCPTEQCSACIYIYICASSMFDGGKFTFFSKRDGYPPNLG